MENNSRPKSKYREILNKIANSKLFIFISGAVAYSLIDWAIPTLLNPKPQSEVIYSKIEIDSIFKDSMFGQIPFKGFRFEITNMGDEQADITNLRLTSFVGMDIGYDPNLVLIGNPSGGELNTETRYFSRRTPLAPDGTSWIKLSMFKPIYDSLSNLYQLKYPNNNVKFPMLHIEYTEGVAKEKKYEKSD